MEKAKFGKIRGFIAGIAFIECLSYDLLIEHQIGDLFLTKPTFKKYTEVDES